MRCTEACLWMPLDGGKKDRYSKNTGRRCDGSEWMKNSFHQWNKCNQITCVKLNIKNVFIQYYEKRENQRKWCGSCAWITTVCSRNWTGILLFMFGNWLKIIFFDILLLAWGLANSWAWIQFRMWLTIWRCCHVFSCLTFFKIHFSLSLSYSNPHASTQTLWKYGVIIARGSVRAFSCC